MGFFSRKKKIFVSSVVYNLAGDENERPNFMKSLILGSVIAKNPSISDSILRGYLNGPGIRFRNFGKYARDSGYTNLVGQTSPRLSGGGPIPGTVVAAQIPPLPGTTVHVEAAQYGPADFTYWVDQALLIDGPDNILRPYEADYVASTGQIHVYYQDTGEDIHFTPSGYNPDGEYIYASYTYGTNASSEPLVPGDWQVVPTGESLPSTSGWEVVDDGSSSQTQAVNRKVTKLVTYSDNRPSETTVTDTPGSETFIGGDIKYKRVDYLGANADGNLISQTKYMTQRKEGSVTVQTTTSTTNETIAGGVIKTTKTTTEQDIFVLVQSYKIDTQDDILTGQSQYYIYIYQKGTGNPTLDALFKPITFTGSFFPFIPFRIDNKFVSDTQYPALYEPSKKAFKKATTGKYTEVVKSMADNASLGDIDYAYAVFGVSLNAKENASKKYVFRFFQEMLANYSLSNYTEFLIWQAGWNQANNDIYNWVNWRLAQDNGGPLFGTPEPPQGTYPNMPVNAIRIGSRGNAPMNYDVTVSWAYIREQTGTGLFTPTAKVGDVFITALTRDTLIGKAYWVGDEPGIIDMDEILIGSCYVAMQETKTTWRRLIIGGLKYRNLIYQGKAVEIECDDAIKDTDESGFIIPLHEGIYKRMGIKDGTQMSTACSFMVFNCYTVVKQKWYQTGLFKVIIVIIVVIVSVLSGGSTSGLIGPALQVGAAVGFTGTVAIIVGAIINAIAAMVVGMIISAGASKLLGDELGAIVGAIASFVAIGMADGSLSTESFSAAFTDMMSADNILSMTAAVAKGATGYLQAQAQGYIDDATSYAVTYKEQMAEINAKMAEQFGTGQAYLDPTYIADALLRFDAAMEPINSFLGRTLLTGSQVAELSHELVNNFADINLTLNYPT